jgi:biopolymer transport protein ExbD
MTLQSSINVSRATSSGKQGAATRAARIEITIRDDNNLTINRTPIPRAGFRDALRPMLATAQTRDVVVRCADGVSHGTFVSVLDEAKVEGAGRIAVVGR